MDFVETVRSSRVVLTEGAVIERLRRDPRISLHDEVAHAALIYEPEPARILEQIYRQYIDIGRDAGLPLICLTPTWRANPERLRAASLHRRDVNGDGVRFLADIRSTYGGYASSVFIGGLIGCRGDCYRPEEALSANEAANFHREQTELLAEAGVDFLFASTLPAISEARGIARTFAATGLPYILSFVLTGEASMLNEAIQTIDSEVSPAPLGYMVNCVHHSRLNSSHPRLLGLQANASAKSHQELDGSPTLDSEDPALFASGMAALHERFGLRILGGCCGTDDRHIRALAATLLQKA